MGSRGTLLLIVVAAALLAAGAAGILGAGRGTTESSPSAPAVPARLAPGVPGSLVDPEGSPTDGPPLLRTVPWGRDAGADPAALGTGSEDGGIAAPGDDTGGEKGAGDRSAGLVTEWVFSAPGADSLPASPAPDPSTGEVPAVEAGRPPEMALAAFVEARGAVAKAAELVGDRRPELEEGVPVSITGRVLETEGSAPVVGATVLLTSTFYVRRYFYDHHLREVARAETDADGKYAVERLNIDPAHFGEGGLLHLTVTAPDHAPALAIPLATVTPGVANRLQDVSLACAAETVTGRLLDYRDGRPVAGARVVATGAIDPVSYPKDERPALFVGAPETVTDAEGRFTLTGLGRGMQVLSFHGGDDCLGREAVVLPREGVVEIRARAIRGRIEGRTVDAEERPVALVTVEGGGNSTHSFADGRWVLENFDGDSVAIRFTHPDFPPVVLPGVEDGAAGLVVRMERPRPVLVLEVRDFATGDPVRSVLIEFVFEEGTEAPAGTSPARLAKDGRYRVAIPAGAVAIRIATPDGRTAEVPLAGRMEEEVVPVLVR